MSWSKQIDIYTILMTVFIVCNDASHALCVVSNFLFFYTCINIQPWGMKTVVTYHIHKFCDYIMMKSERTNVDMYHIYKASTDVVLDLQRKNICLF